MIVEKIDPLWYAMSKLRRNKLEECITICDEILSANPGDQVMIHLVVLLSAMFQLIETIL